MTKHFKYIFLGIFLQTWLNVQGQSPITSKDNAQTGNVINALLEEANKKEMFPGLSIAFLTDDSVSYFNFGYAKLNSKEIVSSQTMFQLGSVGKLLTAIAVLQQVDKGKLDLYTDITEYIKIPGLISDNHNPITLHCLLTHSCGFNDVNIGYMAKNAESVLALNEFAEEFYPDLFQAPNSEIVYSNYSYALAGLIVQTVTGSKFETYVEENIFTTLNMKNSTLSFPYNYDENPNYANAYKKPNEGFDEVKLYPRHAIPAGSLVSNSEDMGLFIIALFNHDSNLLSEDSWKHFFTQQFTNNTLLNGYSYGLERQNINGFEAWAKGGMLQGMLSNILIVPGEFALFSCINTNDDAFGEYFFKALFDSTFVCTTELKAKIDVNVSKYTGSYRDKRYNHNTVEKIATLFLGEIEVYDNETSDTLLIYHNGKFNSYIPVDTNAFQCVDLPYEYLTFKHNKNGEIETMFRNSNINGLSVPTSYQKTKFYNSPKFVNDQYGFVFLTILSAILFIIASLFVRFIRIWKKEFLESKLLPLSFHLLLSSIVFIVLFHLIKAFYYVFLNMSEFLFGYPLVYSIATYLTYLLVPVSIGYFYVLWKLWKNKKGSLFSRIYGIVVGIALVIHVIFLFYWNFL